LVLIFGSEVCPQILNDEGVDPYACFAFLFFLNSPSVISGDSGNINSDPLSIKGRTIFFGDIIFEIFSLIGAFSEKSIEFCNRLVQPNVVCKPAREFDFGNYAIILLLYKLTCFFRETYVKFLFNYFFGGITDLRYVYALTLTSGFFFSLKLPSLIVVSIPAPALPELDHDRKLFCVVFNPLKLSNSGSSFMLSKSSIRSRSGDLSSGSSKFTVSGCSSKMKAF